MTLSAITYATLAQARAEVGERNPDATDYDAVLLEALRFATARIDEELQKSFAPRVSNHYFNASPIGEGGDVDGLDLRLDTPIVDVTSVTNGGGAVINAGAYTLIPKSGPPYTMIRLKAIGGTYWEYSTEFDPVDAIAVAGVWVDGAPHSGSWLDSLDSLQADINSSATSLTISDASGRDVFRRSPRFSPGQLLSVTTNGTTEYMELLDVDEDTHTLHVKRGARGTTAAAHVQDDSISIWEPDRNIQRACAVWAKYLFKKRGMIEESRFEGVGIIKWAKDMPDEVANILNLHRPKAAGVTIRFV